MATTEPYGARVMRNIVTQCARRGIPSAEVESVLAHIAERAGKSVLEMSAPELKRVQQNLDAHFVSYLEGFKRRGGDATWGLGTPAEALAAAKAEAAAKGQ
jgi:hypothetical protein